jgi:hypothetical protein
LCVNYSQGGYDLLQNSLSAHIRFNQQDYLGKMPSLKELSLQFLSLGFKVFVLFDSAVGDCDDDEWIASGW